MNSRGRTAVIAVGTILGWVALIANMFPWLDLEDAPRTLALVMATAGSVVLALISRSKPVHEVYEMGVEAGKRLAKIEAATSQSREVVPFRQRAVRQ